MPDLEDDSDAFSSDGIFNGAYDDENVGAVADFNNMDDTINERYLLRQTLVYQEKKSDIMVSPSVMMDDSILVLKAKTSM
ncbi:hypothetical protein Tco_0772755 [Tanacetum coccineum]|uniref:Uncharacterized protein n=1 Tax=Tanacetum coccineum TaxID=301880 RepID=A0ABQ4ZIS9_9ASTR